MSTADRVLDLIDTWDSDRKQFPAVLREFIGYAEALSENERDTVLRALAAGLEVDDPNLAAQLAMAGGCLVEWGSEPAPLARAIGDRLRATVQEALRFHTRASALPIVENGIPFANGALERAAVDALHKEDPASVASFYSLDVWYRPAVAAWARDTRALAAAQKDEALVSPIMAMGSDGEGTHWLRLILNASLNEPFILLLPSIEEAWAFTADGITDCGQLSVLLSEVLADPLKRAGVFREPSSEMLTVMKGNGPQQVNATFSSQLHFYSWRASDPQTLRPVDGKFTWLAPGGSGTHSLPADFQPHAIEPLQGRRVLVLAGPGDTKMSQVVRVIGGTRTFGSLQASVSEVRPEDAKVWFARVRGALA